MASTHTVTVTFEGRGPDGGWFKYHQTVDASPGGDNPRFYVEGLRRGLATASERVESALVANYGEPS